MDLPKLLIHRKYFSAPGQFCIKQSKLQFDLESILILVNLEGNKIEKHFSLIGFARYTGLGEF